ncbi:MAG: hypothetical protein AAFY65_10445 [Pseudomonadota bacterium]
MIRGTLFGAVCAFAAQPALACSPLPADTRSQAEILRSSTPVRVTAQCAFTHGGVRDDKYGGIAEDLGGGRVSQILFDGNSTVLVADCTRREAAVLTAPPDPTEDPISTCGPSRYLPLTGPNAILDLSAGGDLRALMARATAVGVREGNPITILNTTPWGTQVPRKDRIDLLCGCKLHYPSSPGAR